MLNGLFSLIGLSWGNGSISVEGSSEAPSFPPAGTILNTLTDQVYPIAQGGGYFSYQGDRPNQYADVYEKTNGTGGTYLDWSNAFNVEFIPQGVYIFTDTTVTNGYGAVEVPSGGSSYSPQYTNPIYVHNGFGSYEYGGESSPQNQPSGSLINFAYNETFTVPDLYYLNGWDYVVDNGKYYNYVWVGNGLDYTTSSVQGNYISYGNVFYTASSMTDVNGTNYSNGTSTNYIHNGNGGYTTIGAGSYYPYGWLIYVNYSYGTTNPVEVPSGSLYYYDSQSYGEAYVWDGTGGYLNVYTWYQPYGTYIGYYDGYNYYWDGVGGYYTA